MTLGLDDCVLLPLPLRSRIFFEGAQRVLHLALSGSWGVCSEAQRRGSAYRYPYVSLRSYVSPK